MKRLLLALALTLAPSIAFAQNTTCANRPSGDSSNACANTRFVQSHIPPATPLGVPTPATKYGVKCDGSTDDTANINTALATEDAIILPSGSCITSGVITMNRATNILYGAGIQTTTIRSNAGATPIISIGATPTFWSVQDMTILHSVTASSGGDGIQAFNTTNNALILNVITELNWNGLNLGPCLYGLVQNVTSQLNNAYGIIMTNNTTVGGLQWQLQTIISSQNVNSGIFVNSPVSSSSGAATLGQWTNISTFANSDFGIVFQGTPNVPVANIRVNGAFLGQDGKSEIYMDTYDVANSHIFNNLALELAGTFNTGPTGSVPPSHIGNGMQITANNDMVLVSNSWIHAMSYSGILSAAKGLTITNTAIMNNGGAASAGNRVGVAISAGGGLYISNSRIFNTAGTSQQYGITLDTLAVNNHIINNDLVGPFGAGNSVANISNASTAVNNTIMNNSGWNPVGGHSIPAPGTSTSYTAGPSPETVYVIGSFTGINVGSTSVYGSGSSAAVTLFPNQTMSISYAAGPTINGVIQ